MATSGSTDLATTGTELCYTANQILGQYGADISSLTSDDSSFALKLLNWYMKHIQVAAPGGFLWKRSIAYLFPYSGVLTYTLYSSGAHCTESYVTTTTTAAAAAAATTLTVTSSTGMTTGDQILIPKSDNTYQNTTITVASSTSLTLGTGLAEALASGSRIYTYTTKIDKPLRVFRAGIREYNGDTPQDTELRTVTFNDYQVTRSDKTGIEPTELAYLPQRTTGKVFLNGQNTDLDKLILLVIQKPIEDMDAVGNEPDFPSECFLMLAFKLAYYLSFSLEFSREDRAEINEEANRLFQEILHNDTESVDTRVVGF